MLASELPVALITDVPVRVSFLDVLTEEIVADRRQHRVDAFVLQLEGLVAGLADDVRVVALAAAHLVDAGLAIEPIGRSVADQDVCKRVASAVDR